MSSEETVGQQQPRERPEPSMPDDEIDAERERKRDGLSSIQTKPGDRKTDSVWMLVVEAELVADELVKEYSADGAIERLQSRRQTSNEQLQARCNEAIAYIRREVLADE